MDLTKTILRYKFHHVLIWLLIFGIWFFFRYQDYSTIERALSITSIKVADLAVLIYISNYLLVPHLLYKKRYLLFTASFIVMVVLSSILKMKLIGLILNTTAFTDLSTNFKTRVYDNILPHFFLVIAGVSFKLLIDQIKLQKRLAEIAKEKAEAELNFLKSQINPHFLFNSLNAVYFLIDKQNNEARDALHKFSEMLRYQLYECNGEKIPVEKEINFLKDYVALQRLRLNTNCSVTFNCDEDVSKFNIQPLLLIPLVENSFKHLSHYHDEKQNIVEIDISKRNSHFNFSVSNTTEGKQTNILNKEGGIGLLNVKKRLELLYPDNHKLEVKENKDLYCVSLTIAVN